MNYYEKFFYEKTFTLQMYLSVCVVNVNVLRLSLFCLKGGITLLQGVPPTARNVPLGLQSPHDARRPVSIIF
jgi:hypothetical protein